MGKTLSFCKGKGNIKHNNRDYLTPNVDRSRLDDNVYFKQQTLEDAYTQCYGQAIADYNAHQRRADRRKSIAGYMDEIKHNQSNRNGEKLYYEQVVMVGDMYDTGVLNNPADAQKAKEILTQYVREWENRNPNLHAFNVVLHMDEQTPHLHIDYIPVGYGYKQGIQARNSLTRAFECMGIDSAKTKGDNATIKWQERERQRITEIAKEHGIEIDKLGIERQDLSLSAFKQREARIEKRIKSIKPVEVKRVKLPFNMALERNAKAVDAELQRKVNLRQAKAELDAGIKSAERERSRVTAEYVSRIEEQNRQLFLANNRLENENDRLQARINELEPLANRFKEIVREAQLKALQEHREKSADRLEGKSPWEQVQARMEERKIMDKVESDLLPKPKNKDHVPSR